MTILVPISTADRTNAYMLMYRMVEDNNIYRVEDVEIPTYIKETIEQDKTKELAYKAVNNIYQTFRRKKTPRSKSN